MAKRQHLPPRSNVIRLRPGGPGRVVQFVQEMRATACAHPGRELGGLDGMVRCVEKGWRFLLSYDSTCGMWMFSAQLSPIRSTTQNDWNFLGGACRAVGMPPDVHAEGPMGDSVRTAPESVHKWIWVELASSALGGGGS